MRGPDSDPLTPEMATALLAVDATLAGEPVDPEFAELAELALILRNERPRTGDAFAASLDERVQRRFARPAPAARGTGPRRWLYGSGAALGAALAGFVVVIVLVGGGGSGGPKPLVNDLAKRASQSVTAASSAASSGSGAIAGSSSSASSPTPAPPTAQHSAASQSAPAAPGAAGSSGTTTIGSGSGATTIGSASGGTSGSSAAATPAPAPVNGNGKRQIVQSAQLQLSAAPNRIDDVAQQVFNVVGAENGIVNNSNVTAGGTPNGEAVFALSIPSANLSDTLTALSRLRGAHVLSRTDATSDITGQVGGAGQRLAEARALRRSLLKQLAAAVTTEQVASLKAQLHDADASISSDLSTLRKLQNQVAYSKIAVNIQAAAVPAPVKHSGSGFTIRRGAHDAGRVLVVVAGVALITLAVLVPVGLVAALLAWVGFAVRRRRRDQALDLV
jgi:hypothetical protein